MGGSASLHEVVHMDIAFLVLLKYKTPNFFYKQSDQPNDILPQSTNNIIVLKADNYVKTEWNKALRRIMRIPYKSRRWLLDQLGQQRNLREHLHLKLLRYLTYAINHCNAKMFAHIALGCARSPTGANIALVRHYYGVCFDRNMRNPFVSCTS